MQRRFSGDAGEMQGRYRCCTRSAPPRCCRRASPISPLYLPYTSPIPPLYLRDAVEEPPLYLPYISPIPPLYLRDAVEEAVGVVEAAALQLDRVRGERLHAQQPEEHLLRVRVRARVRAGLG